tara:strand:+ start:932 stop:1210 length:279 start_codon:yes stop_codon:yes gene_type:complete
MASNKRVLGICDVCGFQYPHRSLIKNSYGMLVCPTDYEGKFDLKNHPQNKSPNVKDNEFVKNPRPPSYLERNKNWEQTATNFEDTDNYWNLI